MSAGGRARALLLALAVSISSEAGAKPPPAAPGATQEMQEVAKGAEGLLAKLEYQRARELLEATVQSPKFRSASKGARARLWALLGRARAEMGDPVGMDESFVEAVRLDRSVKLPKGTSPKIVAALEGARVNAPPPEEETAPPLIPVSKAPQTEERPPQKPDAGVVPEIVAPPPKPEVEKPPKPEVEKPPKPELVKPPKPERVEPPREKPPREKPPREKPPREKPPREKPEPPPEREPPETGEGPLIRGRVEGVATPGGKLRLVADLIDIPKTAKITAMLRRTQAGSFEPAPMVRTGTTATLTLVMDRPRIEAWIEARIGAKLIAKAGSEDRPIILAAAPSPPPLGDAWAEAPPEPPPEPPRPSRSSTAAAAAAQPATPPPLVPPPAKPAEDEGLGTVEIALIAGGSAVVLIGLTTLVVVLAAGGGAGCDSPDGFGCAQVQVLRGAP